MTMIIVKIEKDNSHWKLYWYAQHKLDNDLIAMIAQW